MKPNLSRIARTTRTAMIEHSPEILTGIGIAGMFTTVVLAVKATPKALDLISQEEYENRRELTPMETVKTAWKPYVPAVITGALSTACLIGANSVNAKRNAALAAAYTLSDTAFREYKEKVVETLGEKKEKAIKDKVAEQQVVNNPVGKNEVIVTPKGTALCYDSISGRYFKSDIDKIKTAQNDLNAEILSSFCGYVSLNEFYDKLGLPYIDIGDDLGWNLDNRVDLCISATVAEDGSPCLVVGHNTAPVYNYNSH